MAPYVPLHRGPLSFIGTLLLLGVSTAGVVALSCAPVQSVERVAAMGDNVYAALVSRDYASAAGTPYGVRDKPVFAQSADGGYSWHMASGVLETVRDVLSTVQPVPTVACGYGERRHFYRVDGQAKVDESHDGGQSWLVAWQIPPNRQEYVRRLRQASEFTGCGRQANFHAVGLAIVGRSDGDIPVVAMGSEGVLVRNASGGWQQVAVLDTQPTRFATNDPFLATALMSELGFGVVATVLIFHVFLERSRAIASRRQQIAGKPYARALWNPTLLLLVYLLLLFILAIDLVAFEDSLGFFGCLIVPSLLVIFLLLSQIYASARRALSSLDPPDYQALAALGTSMKASVFVFMVWWFSLYGWATGLVPSTEIASAIALTLTATIAFVGVRQIYRFGNSNSFISK